MMDQIITQVLTYILASSLLPKVVLCILFVIMISGIAKMITKMTPLKTNDNTRRLFLSVLNIIAGGCAGLFIFGFTVVDFMIGSTCGYFSAIIYRIGIKKMYKKFDIHVVDDTE